jgi:acetoacetate decarboxylase
MARWASIGALMNRNEILATPSMPAIAPSYPRGAFRFVRREYLIVTYETDEDAVRRALPEPLQPAPGALAYYEWMKMPDASGFGDYQESGCGVLATLMASPAISQCRCTWMTNHRSPAAGRSGDFQKNTGRRD